MGTSNLQPCWTEVVSHLGTNYLQWASEVEGLIPKPVESDTVFT